MAANQTLADLSTTRFPHLDHPVLQLNPGILAVR